MKQNILNKYKSYCVICCNVSFTSKRLFVAQALFSLYASIRIHTAAFLHTCMDNFFKTESWFMQTFLVPPCSPVLKCPW